MKNRDHLFPIIFGISMVSLWIIAMVVGNSQ
jgi:hypothetical protein